MANADQVLTGALQAAGQALSLSAVELTNALQVDELVANAPMDPESATGMRALDVIRVYLALRPLVGDDPQAMRHWMRSYNRGTKGVPAEQIQSAEGRDAVLGYLSRF